jgi:hypothetical protein
MRLLLLAWTVFVSLGYARMADACSPCDDRLSLAQTARRADLVAVAVRVGDEEAADRGIRYAPFEITGTLKGTASASRILVATRYGMCPYGVDVELLTPSVLFLEAHEGRYESVRQGCAVKNLPIVDGKVVLSDIELPIDTLAAELGLSPAPRSKPSESPRWFIFALVGLAMVSGLVASFWLGRRSAR